MAFIPHPIVPLGHLRPYDILLLLAWGAIWEFLSRGWLILQKRRPASLKLRQYKFQALSTQVQKSRTLGPQAFVETSKLERQLLAEEKSLNALKESRKEVMLQYQRMIRTADLVQCFIVFFVWFGVPIFEFSGHRVHSADTVYTEEEANDLAMRMFQSFLFPLSYVGLGIKISKWGLNNPKSSVGALLVFWSSQTFVSQLMDALEAIVLLRN